MTANQLFLTRSTASLAEIDSLSHCLQCRNLPECWRNIPIAAIEAKVQSSTPSLAKRGLPFSIALGPHPATLSQVVQRLIDAFVYVVSIFSPNVSEFHFTYLIRPS